MTKDQQRFASIIQQIDNLMEEAINLIPEDLVEGSKSSWYSHIMCALNNNHEFLVRSSCHMESTLEEWTEQEEDSSDNNRCFMSQEEEDDWFASNPPQRNYCLECGNDFKVFTHNCSESSSYEENYGCSTCDDQCGHCNV